MRTPVSMWAAAVVLAGCAGTAPSHDAKAPGDEHELSCGSAGHCRERAIEFCASRYDLSDYEIVGRKAGTSVIIRCTS